MDIAPYTEEDIDALRFREARGRNVRVVAAWFDDENDAGLMAALGAPRRRHWRKFWQAFTGLERDEIAEPDRADTERMDAWRRDRMDGSLLTPAMSCELDREEYEQS